MKNQKTFPELKKGHIKNQKTFLLMKKGGIKNQKTFPVMEKKLIRVLKPNFFSHMISFIDIGQAALLAVPQSDLARKWPKRVSDLSTFNLQCIKVMIHINKTRFKFLTFFKASICTLYTVYDI